MSIYKELLHIFLKLGFFAYGGPAAHIALMREEVVEKRHWYSDKEFLTMLSFTNLIPGPNSTEMALLIGYKKAKFIGLLIAGFSFILPAVSIVIAITAFYVSYKDIPQIATIFEGAVPAIFSIILVAVYKLSKSSFKTANTCFIFIICLMLLFFNFSEFTVLALGGLLSLYLHFFHSKNKLSSIEPFSLSFLFFSFIKIGSVLYGSGYVLISFLRTTFVENLQWITHQELLDMVVIGEVTPGPVFTTATAIGYLLNGLSGSFLATVGIFLPSFLFIGIVYPFYEKLLSITWITILLEGVNAASVAIIFFVAIQLGFSAISGIYSFLFVLVSLFFLTKEKLSPISIMMISSLIGWFGLF